MNKNSVINIRVDLATKQHIQEVAQDNNCSVSELLLNNINSPTFSNYEFALLLQCCSAKLLDLKRFIQTLDDNPDTKSGMTNIYNQDKKTINDVSSLMDKLVTMRYK